ncbi:metalloproteinase inhibitor 2-like [Mizuhopecten yessoensis]|uniref:Metalloproteinase inhibitor 2 n=1 Tax=Mizuhopecten yessoensis TaxID=6573 RepID=A0A210Q0T6_MIZYE|nr:metalloproteinase inhibitor 2-like [Mizuhopecten yessoensis]OWF42325.1 Metalloproteinase inhibitor 2 [Mizuhopecten yessoensis]
MVFQGFVTVAVIVTLNALQISSQCPECLTKTHPQDAFCQDDFVIRTTITDMKETGDDPTTPEIDPKTSYKIDIVKVFKEPAVPSIEATCIASSLSGNATVGCFFSLHALNASLPCGVELEVDSLQEYLISGTVEDGKMIIDACSLAIPWEEVTGHMKIGLNKRYKKNCQCETGEDKCIVEPPEDELCFCQYATCVEVKKVGCAPVCKWKKSKTFKTCLGSA